MKQIFLLLLVFGISIFSNSCTTQTNKQTKATEFKVMAWNIFHGGNDKDLPKSGVPDIINIIKESKADVVLMIETYGSAPEIAKGLGFKYELLSDNLCIFSRYPINKKLLFTDTISSFNFGGTEININGKTVVFFDAWLHYLPDERLAPLDKSENEIIAWEKSGSRDDELVAILSAIKPYIDNAKNVPIIIGGDFNTHSHLDWTIATKNMYNHKNKSIKWPISEMMINAGFTDTYRHVNKLPEKNIGTTWLSIVGGENDSLRFTRRDRIDYIYKCGDQLNITASENGVAPFSHYFNYKGVDYQNFPSDHGFVLTSFTLE